MGSEEIYASYVNNFDVNKSEDGKESENTIEDSEEFSSVALNSEKKVPPNIEFDYNVYGYVNDECNEDDLQNNRFLNVHLTETEYEIFLDIPCGLQFTSPIVEGAVKTDEDQAETITDKAIPSVSHKAVETQTPKITMLDKWLGGMERANTMDESTLVNNEILYDEYSTTCCRPTGLSLTTKVMSRLLSINNQPLIKASIYHLKPDPSNELSSYKPRLLQELTDPQMSGYEITAVAANPYLRHILAVGLSKPKQDGGVALVSLKNTTMPEKIIHLAVPVISVAFSSHSPNWLAAGMENGEVWLINVSPPQMEVKKKVSSVSHEAVRAVQWWRLPDSKPDVLVYSLAEELMILRHPLTLSNKSRPLLSLFRWEKEACTDLPLTCGASITCMMHCRDDPQLYIVGTEDGHLQLNCINPTMEQAAKYPAHIPFVSSLKPVPHLTKAYVSSGCDGCVKLWLGAETEPIVTLHGAADNEELLDAAWSPLHANVAAAISGSLLHIWDFRRRTHAPMATTDFQLKLLNVEFSNEGDYLQVGTESGKLLFIVLDGMPQPEHSKTNSFILAIKHYLRVNGKQDLCKRLKITGVFTS